MENIETIEMTYTDAIKALEIYKLNISETTLAKNDYINHISLDDYMELLMNDSHEIVIPSVSNVMLKILDYVPDLKTFSHSDYSVAAGVIDVGVADVEVHVLRTSRCNRVTTIGLWIDHSRQVVYMAYAPALRFIRMEILLWWGILYINKARHNVIISWDEHRSNFIANNLDLWAKDAACIERDLHRAYNEGLIMPMMHGLIADNLIKYRILTRFPIQFTTSVAIDKLREIDWNSPDEEIWTEFTQIYPGIPMLKRFVEIISSQITGKYEAVTRVYADVKLTSIYHSN